MGADDLSKYVEAVCKLSIPIERPLDYTLVAFAGFVLLLGVVFIRLFANQLKFLYANPKIWTIVSLV